jgi:hypothetical protein
MNVSPTDAGSLVQAKLEGGPDDIAPARRCLSVDVAVSKVKIEHLGGYEHFERQEHAPEPASGPLVFRWTTRTRIAE